MAKGGQFERDICRTLSVWWSGGRHDDLLWRTSNSGGRATVRGRQGKRTTGHCGDICSTHKSSLPLVKAITFELKRGYSKASVAQLLDRPETAAQQTFEEFIEQAVSAGRRAGTPYWMIIHKRDKRGTMVYFPVSLFDGLVDMGCLFSGATGGYLAADYKLKDKSWDRVKLVFMAIETFLKGVSPQDIKLLSQRARGKRRKRP